jgi:hypothetical protein
VGQWLHVQSHQPGQIIRFVQVNAKETEPASLETEFLKDPEGQLDLETHQDILDKLLVESGIAVVGDDAGLGETPDWEEGVGELFPDLI